MHLNTACLGQLLSLSDLLDLAKRTQQHTELKPEYSTGWNQPHREGIWVQENCVETVGFMVLNLYDSRHASLD